MAHVLENLDPNKYFIDPDMPFAGLEKTEDNLKAIKKICEDCKPKKLTKEQIEFLDFGTK